MDKGHCADAQACLIHLRSTRAVLMQALLDDEAPRRLDEKLLGYCIGRGG